MRAEAALGEGVSLARPISWAGAPQKPDAPGIAALADCEGVL